MNIEHPPFLPPLSFQNRLPSFSSTFLTQFKMSDTSTKTAYPSIELKAQLQPGSKGLDSKMEPGANWTQLEYWTNDDEPKPYLQEYKGQGLLKDKAVLITGADSGIGRSVAILMAREGADISFVHLPEEEEDAQYTKTKIEDAGRKAHLMPLDITSQENCQKAIDEHMKTFGKLNVLVNNSAMQEMCGDLRDIDLGMVEKTFRTNVLSMIALCKMALPHMKRGSSIVNSCSVAAYMGNPQLVDYSATKGAIATFTRSLAQQQAPKGIRVNAVAPGIMYVQRSVYQAILIIPAGRRCSQPQRDRKQRTWKDSEPRQHLYNEPVCQSKLLARTYFSHLHWALTLPARSSMALAALRCKGKN